MIGHLRPRRLRTRIAAGLGISIVLLAAVVTVAATVLAAWRPSHTSDGAQAGAARVGEDVTVVIVADEGADAAASQARRDTLRWGLIVLGISAIPAVGVGWVVAGRLLGPVDDAVARLEAAEAERQQRLQEVIHELRTPLAIMGSNLELAEPASDEAGGFIDAARRAASRMQRTIDDLAGHGRLAVRTTDEAVSLDLLANEAASEHIGPAAARGVRVLVSRSPSVDVQRADRAAVRTALGNFVSNAVRLAPSGSAVILDWGTSRGWAWVSVTDEGPGLPLHLHGRVFERGWRGRHQTDRGDADTHAGLGLTIARQLTEAQAGAVTVESDEGGGSTFAIWLPLTEHARRSDILADDGVHAVPHPWRDDLIPA